MSASPPPTGLLVSVDGPAGAGKTTLLNALTDRLTAEGVPCTRVHAPSHRGIGQLIRSRIDEWPPRVLVHLMAADRYHTLHTVITPALAAGTVVLADRYLLSSYVLQYLSGAGLEDIDAANAAAPRPDVAVLLGGRPDVIARRLAERGPHCALHQRDGITADELKLYAELATRAPARLRTLHLDTTAHTPQQLADETCAAILSLTETRS